MFMPDEIRTSCKTNLHQQAILEEPLLHIVWVTLVSHIEECWPRMRSDDVVRMAVTDHHTHSGDIVSAYPVCPR